MHFRPVLHLNLIKSFYVAGIWSSEWVKFLEEMLLATDLYRSRSRLQLWKSSSDQEIFRVKWDGFRLSCGNSWAEVTLKVKWDDILSDCQIVSEQQEPFSWLR